MHAACRTRPAGPPLQAVHFRHLWGVQGRCIWQYTGCSTQQYTAAAGKAVASGLRSVSETEGGAACYEQDVMGMGRRALLRDPGRPQPGAHWFIYSHLC